MSYAQQLSPKGIALLIALGFGWGLNWPIMKYIIAEIPPLWFRGFCLLVGGLGILALTHVSRQSLRIPKGYLPQVLWICLFNIAAWHVMATYGLSMLPAGRSALLGYTMPIWAVILSVVLLKNPFTPRIAIALLLGMTGAGLLVTPALVTLTQGGLYSEQSSHLVTGALLMIAAAWCWAFGTVLMKSWEIPMNSLALTGWLLLMASFPILCGAYSFEEMPKHWPSRWVFWGLVYNVFIGFMFSYWAWIRLVSLVPVSVSSLSSLITPLIGVISSIILLGEKPSTLDIGAAFLILTAVFVINWNFSKKPQK